MVYTVVGMRDVKSNKAQPHIFKELNMCIHHSLGQKNHKYVVFKSTLCQRGAAKREIAAPNPNDIMVVVEI